MADVLAGTAPRGQHGAPPAASGSGGLLSDSLALDDNARRRALARKRVRRLTRAAPALQAKRDHLPPAMARPEPGVPRRQG